MIKKSLKIKRKIISLLLKFSNIDFPATFKSKDVEGDWYNVWQSNKYFAASSTRTKTSSNKQEKNEPFTMVLPPPNITGVLHLGHAFTATIQDVLARWLVKMFI